MSFIEVKNVTKKFDNEPVLKNINIDIYEGEVLGVLGRSGSGKSVLFFIILQSYCCFPAKMSSMPPCCQHPA